MNGMALFIGFRYLRGKDDVSTRFQMYEVLLRIVAVPILIHSHNVPVGREL